MNTPLALRKPSVRLAVAYLAHARYDYQACSPDNSFSRFANYCGDLVSSDIDSHPWHKMWCSIGKFYTTMKYDEMSDDEILDQYNAALRVGFKTPTRQIEAAAVQQAVKDWNQRGWKRYVQRSASRHGLATKLAIGSLVIFGIDLPADA